MKPITNLKPKFTIQIRLKTEPNRTKYQIHNSGKYFFSCGYGSVFGFLLASRFSSRIRECMFGS
ncbi:hypothetical protein Hanom_Chr02g00176571 [Helianthus anomalus]